MDWQSILFNFMGGLGLFLFSIKFMGDGLQAIAGDRLRSILDRFTTNPFMGILVGIAATVLIQSSSGTTVIVIGLVSAGLMTLRQAIGVIMGANIGTTVTAFIIGLDIGAYAYPILLIGAILLFFFKAKYIQNLGQIFFGLGGIFIGLELMNNGLSPLANLPLFITLTLELSDNALLGVVVGTLMTLIVQSSSATVGILQSLYADGLLDLTAALPILFGDNIGTTITAILASLTASVTAKRAAMVHVLFNIIGAMVFLVFLLPFTHLIIFLTEMLALGAKMQIAFAHGAFNTLNTLIHFPFIGLLAFLVSTIIVDKEEEEEAKISLYLDDSIIKKSPAIAVGQVHKEVVHMGDTVVEGLKLTQQYLKTNELQYAEKALLIELKVNTLEEEIIKYIVKTFPSITSLKDSHLLQAHLDLVMNLERIGDHFENVIEQVEFMIKRDATLTDEAHHEITEMFLEVISAVEKSLLSFNLRDRTMADEVIKLEDWIDEREKTLRKRHIKRLKQGECSPKTGLVFTDLISNFERIGDHAKNIADIVLEIT